MRVYVRILLGCNDSVRNKKSVIQVAINTYRFDLV